MTVENVLSNIVLRTRDNVMYNVSVNDSWKCDE